jgi:hypothetical protein
MHAALFNARTEALFVAVTDPQFRLNMADVDVDRPHADAAIALVLRFESPADCAAFIAKVYGSLFEYIDVPARMRWARTTVTTLYPDAPHPTSLHATPAELGAVPVAA